MDGPTATASDTQARAERYAARAQYYRPANIFIVKRPAVPCHRFDAECEQALATDGESAWIACDVGTQMGFDWPATTPLILVRYAKVAPNATLTGSFVSSGEQYYVIRGSGDLIKGDDAIPFAADDIVTLPGGGETRIEAGADGAVLLQATNEPEMAFHRVAVPTPEDGPMEAALFRASELADELERFRQDVMDDPTRSGLALHMNNAKLGAHYSTHPSIVLAINSLDPHRQQRPHHHNSVAVTMPIRCDRVHSVIDGQRVDWKQYTPMITPPAAMHEHINEGDEMMMSLVVQDGGMHYHLRTIGFGFGDVQAR
jgi:gentisate 1,2-dioxygenase